MPSSVAYSETRALAPDHGRALNGAHRLGESKSPMDEGRPKNEDIFLNIARTDSGRRDSLGRSDFRRSRLGYSGPSLRSPTSRFDPEQTPSPDQRLNNADDPLLSQNGSPTIPYSSATYSPAASAHPLDEPARFRYSTLNSGARSTIGVPRSRLSRTSPETSPRSPAINGERRSSLHDSRLRHSALSTIRSSRQPSASEATERVRAEPEKPRADGTESTLSTTAPSTLELTGKLPPSSQAAMTGVAQERPRTAATTVTALSTSPRHYRKVSTPSADADSALQSQVHPILQSALEKAKAVLGSDVYAALEVTINDALTLSTILGVNTAPSGTVSVVNGGYSSSDRHARRKADSVCRSLTELCLTLTDEQLKKNQSPPRQSQRANSGDTETLRPGSAYQRSSSHEPENVERSERRQSTSRISSRLESRRASLAKPSPGTATETSSAQSPTIPTPPSRLHRISTSLRSRRLPVDEQGGETPSPHSRSLSRAVTEIGTPSPAQNISPRQQRLSHGHSASRSISGAQHEQQGLGISPRASQFQNPPSSQPPQTPTTPSQTGIPFRRSYMAPAVYSPATSRSNIQAGSRRYGLSPNFSNTPGSGADESPRSPRLEASQTRISVPSSKTVTSYTPIQQPRLRTNSLGTRRFGLRTRATATPDESVHLDDSID
ncbi:hypothetical protein N7512_009821 [Penicillium capsulatum]|nr:hypothetical protein N7512_009821 [Penicillium capsulatum]